MMPDLGLLPTTEPPSLDGMTDSEKVAAMVEWFHENFEDPAQETPHDSGEGGYLYIWGGPYDANEELQDAFAGQAPDELIEQATSEVQDRDGILDWAPSGNRIGPDPDSYPDRVRTGEIVDGDGEWPPVIAVPENDASEAQKAANVLSRLDELERALQALQLPSAGIGHNQPPEPIETTAPISEEQRQQLIVNIQEIKIEVQSPQPDYAKVEEKAGLLAKAAAKIKSWIAKSLDKAIVAGLALEYPKILDYLHAAGKAIMEWLPPHLPF